MMRAPAFATAALVLASACSPLATDPADEAPAPSPTAGTGGAPAGMEPSPFLEPPAALPPSVGTITAEIDGMPATYSGGSSSELATGPGDLRLRMNGTGGNGGISFVATIEDDNNLVGAVQNTFVEVSTAGMTYNSSGQPAGLVVEGLEEQGSTLRATGWYSAIACPSTGRFTPDQCRRLNGTFNVVVQDNRGGGMPSSDMTASAEADVAVETDEQSF